MKELLGDTNKFERLEVPSDKHLNFVLILRIKLKTFLKA